MKAQQQQQQKETTTAKESTFTIPLSLMARLGMVAQYWNRKPGRLKDIIISADIINKINPTDEERRSWLQNEGDLITFTAEGVAVQPEEYDFSRAEAQDMLDLLNSVDFHVSQVKWALPLQTTLTAALAKNT